MILNKASRGELDVLFMSPEKLMTAAVARRLRTPATPIEAMEAGSLRVGLVCIDEIHCASEWSHNFRYAESLPTLWEKEGANSSP